MVEVQVSVIIFSSDLTLSPLGLPGYLLTGLPGNLICPGLPGNLCPGLTGWNRTGLRGGCGLPGLLGGFLTKFWRSVRPVRHALIGTWIIDFRVTMLASRASILALRAA